MAQSLGEKIKSLRKELKMTQTDLAGIEMTKSMLSQIENNLAMPSMKNLQYLASRLGKPAAYFIDDDVYQTNLPIDSIHKELKDISKLDNEEALIRLEAIQSKYSFDHSSKLYADFLEKYGDCLINLNHTKEGEEAIQQAVCIYKNKYLFIDASRAFMTLISIHWNKFDYVKCMAILDEAFEIYSNSISKDYAFEIEALFLTSILYTGMDNIEACIQAISEALKISKETNIYYKSDELYKNLALANSFLGKLENFDKHINKARLYATFTDNTRVLASIEIAYAMRCNLSGDYEKAMEALDLALTYSDSAAAHIYTEKAKSCYMLGQYQEALDFIKLVNSPNYIPLKYDYLHICIHKIYEGLCLNKLGKPQEAIAAINQGIERMEIVKESKALAFAYKSLSEIYSDLEDYENAFIALKKANEMSDIAEEKKLYY